VKETLRLFLKDCFEPSTLSENMAEWNVVKIPEENKKEVVVSDTASNDGDGSVSVVTIVDTDDEGEQMSTTSDGGHNKLSEVPVDSNNSATERPIWILGAKMMKMLQDSPVLVKSNHYQHPV
jgi:hypothetical protein